MKWHYESDGEQQGPCSQAEMQDLITNRKIQPDTLIWREGFDDWFAAEHYFRFPKAAHTQPATPVATTATPPPLTGSAPSPRISRTIPTRSEEVPEMSDADLAILDALQSGGRYVYYTYTFSIIVMTFTRSSKVQFIPAKQSRILPGIPYVFVSLLFGWWGIPFGLILTPISMIKSLSGGTDVTEKVIGHEIMRTLDIPSENNGLRICAATIAVLGSISGLIYLLAQQA